MRLTKGMTAAKKDLTLDPPITPEETRWWSKERYKLYGKSMLALGLPFFLVFALSGALTKPEKLAVLIPIYALLSFGAGLIQARVMEGVQRTIKIRSRRIRENILADPVDGNP